MEHQGIQAHLYAELCLRFLLRGDGAAQQALSFATELYCNGRSATATAASQKDLHIIGILDADHRPHDRLQNAWPVLEKVKAAVRKLAHSIASVQRCSRFVDAINVASAGARAAEATDRHAVASAVHHLATTYAGNKDQQGPMHALLCALHVLLALQLSGSHSLCCVRLPDAAITEAAFGAGVRGGAGVRAAHAPLGMAQGTGAPGAGQGIAGNDVDIVIWDVVGVLCGALGLRVDHAEQEEDTNGPQRADGVGAEEGRNEHELLQQAARTGVELISGTRPLFPSPPPAGLTVEDEADWCIQQMEAHYGHITAAAHAGAGRSRTWTCSPWMSDATAVAALRYLPVPSHIHHLLPLPPALPPRGPIGAHVGMDREAQGGQVAVAVGPSTAVHGGQVPYRPSSTLPIHARRTSPLCAPGTFAWAVPSISVLGAAGAAVQVGGAHTGLGTGEGARLNADGHLDRNTDKPLPPPVHGSVATGTTYATSHGRHRRILSRLCPLLSPVAGDGDGEEEEGGGAHYAKVPA